ncbi:MAG: hypothetical protein EOS55_10415 [Mesorhizobium sp.]|nr:MAG: hypothetical protein EOS55_10415 [Mesorhizobium sp.]
MLRTIRAFWHDQRGIALILVSVTLPAIIGFSLLAIDMSRVNNMHNDLQKGADALALATAAELDGQSDSITRGDHALATLVANKYAFSTSGPPQTLAAAGVTRRYLKSLPATDDLPIIAANVITDEVTEAKLARFVEVKVTPVGFSAIFPASFLTGNSASNSFNVGAVAVAGFTSSICDVTPMFMCNPFEAQGLSFQQAFAQGKTYSREFDLLKTSSAPGPGNFGLLQTDLELRTAFATGSVGTCYLRAAVQTKPGVTLGHVNSGLNVRFDIYSGSLKQYDANLSYRPASNVRKGASNSSNCNKFSSDSKTPPDAMGFPQGTAGANYSDEPSLGMTGDGWDRSGYWTLNHGVAIPNIPSTSHPTSSTMPPSRYDVYKYEISNNLVGDKAGGKNNGETGVPACYTGPINTVTATPDRRLFNVAVVNCTADAAKISGRTDLKPDSYASMFLTNPIEKQDKTKDDDDETASEKPIRLEVVDVEGPLGNGSLDQFLRDEVQLYR